MATRTTQRVNSRAAEEQVQLQAQARAQALTSGNTRLSGGDQDAGGSMAKVAQFDSQGNMLRNPDGSPVTTRVSVSGPIVPSTAGGAAALERLNAVAGGARVNQAGVQGAQQLAQSSELQGNLQRLQPGANGKIGQLGFNPVNTTVNQAQGSNQISDLYEPPDFSSGSNLNLTQQEKEALTTERLAQAQIKENIRSTQQQNVARDAAAKAQANGRQVRRTVTTSALDAVIASLPPEDQAVANAYKEVKAAREDAMDVARQNFREGQEIIDENYADEQSMIADMRNKAIADFNVVEDMLSDQRDRNEKMLAEKEEQANQQLIFLETKLVRDAGKQKLAMLDKSIASLALSGGFGSSNGNESIIAAEQEADEAIADLQKEFGFKRADIALSFKESYNQAQEKYEVGFMEAWQAYQNKDDSLDLRALSSTQQKKKDKQANLETLRTAIVGLKQQRATDVLAAAKDVRTMMLESKSESKQDEAKAFEEMKWYKTTFGSTPPDGVMEQLEKRLPAVNVRSFFSTQTASDIEKQAKRSGISRSGIVSFGLGDIGVAGPISKADYIEKRVAEHRAAAGQSIDEAAAIAAEEARLGMTMSADARKEFVLSLKANGTDEASIRSLAAEEWEAKSINYGSLDPLQLQKDLDIKLVKANLPEAQQKTIKAAFGRAMEGGDLQHARAIVDEIGGRVAGGQAEDFGNALQTRAQIVTLKQKFDELGTTGPLAGRFRKMDLWDPQLAEYRALLTGTIPSMARGIFMEVGVLTDQDVARYEGVVFNPTSTVAQAELQYDILMNIINTRLNTQISVWDANGQRVTGFKKLLESPITGIESGVSDQDYVKSLPLSF